MAAGTINRWRFWCRRGQYGTQKLTQHSPNSYFCSRLKLADLCSSCHLRTQQTVELVRGGGDMVSFSSLAILTPLGLAAFLL